MGCSKETSEQKITLREIQSAWILVYVQMSPTTVALKIDVSYLQTNKLSLLYSLAVTTAQIQRTRSAKFGSRVALYKFYDPACAIFF